MVAEPWHFESLDESHVIDDFRCGEHQLDHYLRRRALDFQARDTARVFVAVRPGEKVVWAFYTLSNASLPRDALSEEEAAGLPDPVPGTLLGRMAVHRDFQRSAEKLGQRALMNALLRAEFAARTSASCFLMVDPKEDSGAFYLSHGFVPAPGQPERLLYAMSKIRKLGLPPPE